ncbi:MAG: recombinase family protein [Verrucomicrobiota bacterium]|jgi:DNA invertase Pin-like site-specific DNA recombinase
MNELDTLIKSMPKAYSYVRFSTPEQAKGDSLRRQLERSQVYAQEHGLILDSSLNLLDQGLSGYTKENERKGALGVFIKAVESGLVPEGSVLIVESLDRLSRATVLDQIALLSNLVNSGITVVTLDNRQVLTREALDKDPMLLMISVIGMLRAHDESHHKSDRVRAAWANKRKNIGDKKLTSLCPGWLKLTPDRKGFELIPERVALVKRMFEMNAMGIGQMSIARAFNSERIPVWGRAKQGWHLSFIQRILHTRTVLGEFQPCRWDGQKSIPDGPPIPDYFPAIVELELWQRVQRNTKPIPPGRTGPRLSNLFGGRIYDGYTNTPMRHISRRSGRGPYQTGGRLYYLASDYGQMAIEDKGKATSWRYDWFEALFLQYVLRLDWAALAREAAPLEDSEIRKRLEAQQCQLKDYQQQLKRLGDILATTDQTAPQTLLARMRELEKAEATAKGALIAIAKEAAVSEARRSVMLESGEKIKALVKDGDYDSRMRLREEIRRKIDRIDVFANGLPENLMAEQPVSAPGWPAFKLTFANGTERWVFCESKRPEKDSAALLDFDPSQPVPPEPVPHVY